MPYLSMGNALHAHAEGKAGVDLGIEAHPPQHLGVHHAGAQYLNPAGVAAQAAAGALAHEAVDGHLDARLHEGEVVAAEARLAVRAEEAAGKLK